MFARKPSSKSDAQLVVDRTLWAVDYKNSFGRVVGSQECKGLELALYVMDEAERSHPGLEAHARRLGEVR